MHSAHPAGPILLQFPVTGVVEHPFAESIRYKAGTAKFASWLAEVGKSCGESIDNIASISSQAVDKGPREKTNKKKSRDTKPFSTENTYTIPVRHFIEVAEAIVRFKTPKKVVPTSIFALLCDVISLRKEVSQILGPAITQGDGPSDGHSYFIDILEQVREILRPSTQKVEVRDEKRLETADQKLGNIFEALTLEESLDVVDSSSVPKSVQPDRKPLPRQTYDIESMHDDILTSSLFFFHDLNEIRELIRAVWLDYSQGKADLSTASLVTNTAIEIIQRNLDDHLAAMAGQHGAPEQQNWIWWVYAHICHGMDFQNLETPEDPINFETYQQADYVCYLVFDIIQAFMEGNPSHQLTFIKNRHGSTEFPESPRERFGADHLFLHLILSDLHNATKLGLDPGPAIDDITRVFLKDKVSETKLTPLWLTFAMQILVDIRHVLRHDTSQAFQELQATGQRLTSVIRYYFQFSRTQEWEKERWHKDNDPQILKLVSFTSLWINQDILSKAIRKQSKQSPEEQGVELPPFFLMKQHPLLCGSIAYWLNLSLHEFGVSLANAYDSILSAAHLYNAARQLKLLDTAWPDMEYLISVHTTQRIFVGGPPTRPEDFFKRFQMVLGASALNFARNRRAIRPQESSKDAGSRRLRKSMPIHDIFRARYCSYETRAELTNTKLEVIITEVVNRHPEMDHIVSYANQWARTRKLASLQLLSILGVAVTDEDLHLHFDYISMHIRCTTLLSEMRQKFIRGAEVETGEKTERSLSRFLAASNMSLSRFLAEDIITEEYCAIKTTISIFLADPDGAGAAQNYDADAPMFSALLRQANVSLERASKWVGEVIKTEGDIDIKKAKALCRPIIVSDDVPEASALAAI